MISFSGLVSSIIIVYYGSNIYKLYQYSLPPINDKNGVYSVYKDFETLKIRLSISDKFILDDAAVEVVVLEVPNKLHVSEQLPHRKKTESGFAFISLDPLKNIHYSFKIPEKYQNSNLQLYIHGVMDTGDYSGLITTIPFSKKLPYPQGTNHMKRYLTQKNDQAIIYPREMHLVPKHFLVGAIIFNEPLDIIELYNRGIRLTYVDEQINFPLMINIDVTPRDEFVPMDSEINVSYSAVTYGSWILRTYFSNIINDMEKNWRMAAYDIDSLKMSLLGAEPWIILTILGICAFHIIFEFLAVSSDLTFWRDRTSFVEFSSTAIQLDIFNELIILYYLHYCGESKFTLAGVFLGVCLNIYKLSKIPKGFRLYTRDDSPPKLISGTTVTNHELEDFENKCIKKLGLLIAPIIISTSLYTLLYQKHTCFKAWIVETAAICAYTGGFLTMTPQLFRNYKLKQVDHLPWHALTYQAINTFIDDVFTFIIRMPQMHRLSVFRDDIIFIVYHIQRFMYKRKQKEE